MRCTKNLTPDEEATSTPLRVAGPGDVEALAALDELCFAGAAWARSAWRTLLSEPDWITLVWCPDSLVRGAAVILPAFPEAALASLAVHPAFRRRGAGHALLARAIHLAEQAGARWLALEVDCDNTPAIALYRRFRFHVSRRFREDGRPRLEMRRRLAVSSDCRAAPAGLL